MYSSISSSSVLAKNDQSGFSSKILSRQSTTGGSSRIYYRDSEGVPFQWEKQPGTPINPPMDDVLPPLSPPPAALSLGVTARPCTNMEDQDHQPIFKSPIIKPYSRVWIWNKIKSLSRHSYNPKRSHHDHHYNNKGNNTSRSVDSQDESGRISKRILLDRRGCSRVVGVSSRKSHEISVGHHVRGGFWDLIGGSERKGAHYHAPNQVADRSPACSSSSLSTSSSPTNYNNNSNPTTTTTATHHHADHPNTLVKSSSSSWSINTNNKNMEEEYEAGTPFTCNPSTFMVRFVK